MQTIIDDRTVIHAKYELNDLMGEALYYMDRAWGINNVADDRDWCPTTSAVVNAAAEVSLLAFLTQLDRLENMIAVYNEHSESGYMLALEWDEYAQEWDV